MKLLYSVFAACILFSVMTGCSNEGEQSTEENSESGLVTLQDFNQIKKGMTYEEVKELVGTEGTLMTAEDDDVTMYVWDGVAPDSFMSLTFKQNGKLSEKVQNGLK
ncbi:DUF3862 domain-containing protein [Bacillus salacetis]|uniref:DUF3862 domain-containing protein n=1 Tax=Bacillus salacetis TaxID=2315464 RepID=UPI003BA14722